MSFAVERNVRQARRILKVRADAVEAAAQIRWQASLDLAIAQVDLHPERIVEAVPQRLAAGLRTCGERRHMYPVSVLPGTGVRDCPAISVQTAPEHECRKRCEHAVHRGDRIPQLQLVAEKIGRASCRERV